MEQTIASSPRQANAAKFVFLYLLSLISLIFMTISFGIIIFQIINKFVPDVAGLIYSGTYLEGPLKFAISAILVSALVFYGVNYLIYGSLYKGELKKDSGIRRWLTYLLMFISFLVFFGWLIAFINNFLNGEVTLKFILKTISVLAIAAAVFGFYLYDIRRQVVENIHDRVLKNYFIASVAAVAVIFIASFFVVENPKLTRDRRLDVEIINSFYSLESCVNQYYMDNKKMAESMADLQGNCKFLTDDQIRDKETGRAFEYHKKEGKTYELCANFRTSNKDNKDPSQMGYYGSDKEMLHDSGWQCLERKVIAEMKID